MAANTPEKKFTLRCSTVYVAEGQETFVFRSLEEMPDPLRKKILKGARSGGAATIFIANRGGREELALRLKGLPSRVKTRLERSVEPSKAPAAIVEPPRFASASGDGLSPSVRHALLLAAGMSLLAALLYYWR